MASLFRPTYSRKNPETGESESYQLSKWYGKYRDENGVLRKVPFSEDKSAAQAMLADLLRNVERRKAGLIDPLANQTDRPVVDFVNEYQRHLEVKKRSERHIVETVRMINKILAKINCSVVGDLRSAEKSLEEYIGRRMDSGSSHRTVNADIVAIRAFCRWLMQKKQCLTFDPTGGIEKLNVAEDRRHNRRALTDEETQRLIQTTFESKRDFRNLTGKDRAMLYMLAQRTGLRRGELMSLTPGSFDWSGQLSTVIVNAGKSKRRKTETIPLPQDLAIVLQNYLKDRSKSEPVWPGTWWERSSKMIQLDLKDAGIEPKDSSGRILDFHGQRTTFITSLARAGVSPATAQRLARHSDVNLTLGAYTKLQASELQEALERLPTLNQKPVDQNPELPEKEQAPKDSDLASVISAWPNLRQAIRKAILALIETE